MTTTDIIIALWIWGALITYRRVYETMATPRILSNGEIYLPPRGPRRLATAIMLGVFTLAFWFALIWKRTFP